MMPAFEVLGPMVRNLHGALSQIYYMALPVAILFAVVIGFFKSGQPDYIDTLKRVFVATILLVAFPEISNAIIGICDGIAARIDDMSGLQDFLRLAKEKSASYPHLKSAILLKFDDLIIAFISFLSFILIYVSRYLTIAMYYFFWVFLSVTSPIMILFYIFPSTAYLTTNLFKGLIQVACWKICWAILSAMLRSLSLGNIYATEGSYITLIVLNFVIAIAMLLTPMIVKATMGEGAQAMAGTIGAGAAAAIFATPAKLAMVKSKAWAGYDRIAQPIAQRYQSYQAKKQSIQNSNKKM